MLRPAVLPGAENGRQYRLVTFCVGERTKTALPASDGYPRDCPAQASLAPARRQPYARACHASRSQAAGGSILLPTSPQPQTDSAVSPAGDCSNIEQLPVPAPERSFSVASLGSSCCI